MLEVEETIGKSGRDRAHWEEIERGLGASRSRLLLL